MLDLIIVEYTRVLKRQLKIKIFLMIFCEGKAKPNGVLAIVDASKNTNGTVYWPTTRTTTVKEFLWIGFYSLHVAFADVHR